MKIAILSNGNANYSTRRLVEEAEKRGHDVKLIKYKKHIGKGKFSIKENRSESSTQ